MLPVLQGLALGGICKQLGSMGNAASAHTCANSSSAQARVADPGKELLRSAEQGEASVVAWILASDAHYLSHSSVFGGNTAWHKAAKTGRVEVFEAMERVVQQHFTVSCKHSREMMAPYRLARLGSSAAEVVGRLVNKANLKGITPLMLACAGGHTDAVAWLLKHGAYLASSIRNNFVMGKQHARRVTQHPWLAASSSNTCSRSVSGEQQQYVYASGSVLWCSAAGDKQCVDLSDWHHVQRTCAHAVNLMPATCK
jgi:hypothetical protein